MSNATLTPEQQVVADVLEKSADDYDQLVRDSMEMDRAWVNGTYDEWFANYRQRELDRFMNMPLPGKANVQAEETA